MHFNNLLLGFRLKAIGGIAVGAVVGIGLKISDLAEPGAVPALFLGLAIIWGGAGVRQIVQWWWRRCLVQKAICGSTA